MDKGYKLLRVLTLAAERAPYFAQKHVIIRHVFDRYAQRRVLLDERLIIAAEELVVSSKRGDCGRQQSSGQV